jgi:hypothetical protein
LVSTQPYDFEITAVNDIYAEDLRNSSIINNVIIN